MLYESYISKMHSIFLFKHGNMYRIRIVKINRSQMAYCASEVLSNTLLCILYAKYNTQFLRNVTLSKFILTYTETFPVSIEIKK